MAQVNTSNFPTNTNSPSTVPTINRNLLPVNSVTNFIANMQRNYDVAKTDKFYVQINLPAGLAFTLNDLTRSLIFQIETAELPGIVLSTTDFRLYGPFRKLPLQTTYNEVGLTILCTNRFYEKPLFDTWINYVNPRELAWDFRYRDEFVGSVQMYQFDLAGNLIYSCVLQKAFPVSSGSLPLHWGDDSPHRLSVVFGFDTWQPTYTTDDSIYGSQLRNFVNQFGLLSPANGIPNQNSHFNTTN